MQANIQASIAVRPSALGVLVVTVLKMLTRTRKRVMRSAILPGMTSGGTTKLIQETTTNRPEQSEYYHNTSKIQYLFCSIECSWLGTSVIRDRYLGIHIYLTVDNT